jgi:hypothetical protein
MKLTIFTISGFLLLLTVFAATAEAQKRRDFLTDEEIELVRDRQQIDQRIEILVVAIDRRFAALNNQPSPIKKNSEKWGAEPKGTRTELISDISKLLQKAIDDIDNLAMNEKGMESPFFPKAVHKLADAAVRFQPLFKTLYDQITVEKERGVILNSIDLCSQIIEAAAKIPKETKKK